MPLDRSSFHPFPCRSIEALKKRISPHQIALRFSYKLNAIFEQRGVCTDLIVPYRDARTNSVIKPIRLQTSVYVNSAVTNY